MAEQWLRRGRKVDDEIIVTAAKRLDGATVADLEWLRRALDDPRHKFFVATLFFGHPIPEPLRDAMLRAAVLEVDPSFNRYFVAPCVRSFGAHWVLEQLVEYLRHGSNAEKAGAANARYWVLDNRSGEALDTVCDAFREAALLEFIGNENLDVRRCLVSMLDFRPGNADGRRRRLIDEAAAIAVGHPDEYIRHRFHLQTGGDGLLMALERVEVPSQPVSLEALRRAASEGNAEAMKSLGSIYWYGNGLARDLAEAFRWYRAAADGGDVEAMYAVGAMLKHGVGIAEDRDVAAAWLRRASEAMLERSYGGPAYAANLSDMGEASRWYEKYEKAAAAIRSC